MTILAYITKRLPDLCVVFLGIWTIYCHFFVFFQLTFNVFVFFSFVPLSITILVSLYIWKERNVVKKIPYTAFAFYKKNKIKSIIQVNNFLIFCVTIVWCISYALGLSYLFFWFGALLLSCILIFNSDTKQTSYVYPINDSYSILILWIVSLSASFITFIAIRQSPDDAYYTSFIFQLLDHGDLPIYKYESMFGLLESPMHIIRRFQAYEIFIAYCSKVLLVKFSILYWVILPCFFAIVIFLSYWNILKEILIANGACIIGVCFLLLLFLTWGDSNRSYPNFALIRLWQGKCVLVTLIIPLIYYYSAHFLKHRTFRNWIMVFLAQCAASGLSINGAFLAPLCLGLIVFAYFAVNRQFLSKIVLTLAGVYPVFLLFVIKLHTSRVLNSTHFGSETSSDFTMEYILNIVIGSKESIHSTLVLFLFLSSGLFVINTNMRKLVSGYVLVFLFFLFNPWTLLPNFFSGHGSSNLFWRSAWVCPMPLILCITAGSLATSKQLSNIKYMGLFLFSLIVILFLSTPHNWVISKDNNTFMAISSRKIAPTMHNACLEILEKLPPECTLLAYEPLSAFLATFHKHPKLIFLRSAYLGRLSPEKRKEMIFLNRLAKGVDVINENTIKQFISIIDKYNVDAFIISNKSKGIQTLAKALENSFFQLSKTNVYTLFVRLGNDCIQSP